MVMEWCLFHSIRQEPFYADWQTDDRSAGPRRNARMVASGADVCLAFALLCAIPECPRNATMGPHWTHGVDNCATRARAAGIPVRPFGIDEDGNGRTAVGVTLYEPCKRCGITYEASSLCTMHRLCGLCHEADGITPRMD